MITLLSADIGGTKTIIELNQFSNGVLQSIKKQTLPSAKYNCFSNMLAGFVEPHYSIDFACFAIAGPVNKKENQKSNHQIAKVTNLSWKMDSQILQDTFDIPHVYFINDFQAMGYAIEHLSNDDIEVLQEGKPLFNGVRAVIGAGTGLGEAILVTNNNHYEVIASEGGHVDFAANDALEFALFEYIHKKYSHVSYERILSGSGLATIFNFLCEHRRVADDDLIRDVAVSSDPAATISMAANEHNHKIAQEALTLFMKIFGAQAGNLALSCLPNGGIYICGGIAKKNHLFLKKKDFLDSFNAKGRMRELMTRIPVKLVMNHEAGLIGSTHYALTLAVKSGY